MKVILRSTSFVLLSYAKCGNYGNSLASIFGKNFVKVTVLLKKLLNKRFDEIFFSESKFP